MVVVEWLYACVFVCVHDCNDTSDAHLKMRHATKNLEIFFPKIEFKHMNFLLKKKTIQRQKESAFGIFSLDFFSQ